MKKIQKNRVTALLILALMLGLSACGKDEAKEAASKESAVSVDNGALKSDSTVISIGKTKVTYEEYQVYSYLLKSKYEGLLTSDVWNYRVKEGQTIGMDATTDIIRLIIQLKVIGKSAEAQGITLAADEKEELAYDAQKFVETLSDEVQTPYKITAKLVTSILEDNEVARKMYDVVTGAVDVNITEEEAQVVKAQVILLMSNGTDKNGMEVNLDDAAKTALYETAKQLQVKAQSGGFYTLAEKNSSISEIEMNIGREDSPVELVHTAFSMQPGQVSDVIQTENGFYIIYCVSVNDSDTVTLHREERIVEKQTKAFQEAYNSWSEKFGVRVSKSLLKK